MTKQEFYKAWVYWEKQGFYFACSPSGVVKYVCDPEGKKIIIAFSDDDRLKQAIAFIR